MKLTKAQTKAHEQAMELVEAAEAGTVITDNDREFILDHYHPGAAHNIGKGGVFFTPREVADTAAGFHNGGGRVLDACAGIGCLAYHLKAWSRSAKLTCVEINPEFVRVGRVVVPDAEWICGSVFDILPQLRQFDSAISNPPFGQIGSAASFNFADAQFAVMELMTRHTKQGAIVIIPDADHSMEDRRDRHLSRNHIKFREMYPAWHITPCSVDMAVFKDKWKGANPKVMICDLSKDS